MTDASRSEPSEEAPVERSDKFPPGIPFIVGNEAAERFSFYGMRAILFVYMAYLYRGFLLESAVSADLAADSKVKATQVVHYFMAGVYAFPMVGAILADRLLGKYSVIMGLSLVYCAGHAVLACFASNEWGMYLGLTLIAIGSGGIKPCVSANVGDQFTKANAHLVEKIYQVFYFSINFGSFFAQLLIPYLYDRFGPEVAFGVPGALMFLATAIFWAGRNRFTRIPPNPGGRLGALDFLSALFLFLAFALFVFETGLSLGTKSLAAGACLVLWFAVFNARRQIQPAAGFVPVLVDFFSPVLSVEQDERRMDALRRKHGTEGVEGFVAVLRIMLVFSMVSVFWALFDQHSSTWVDQAGRMDLRVTKTTTLSASQISFLNPLIVMISIPFLNFLVWNPLSRAGIVVKPLRRMTIGMFLTATSFVAAALLQVTIERAGVGVIHVGWQIPQYTLLTIGEVLVSVTGLEFAYTQAPRSMKSTIMGFWLLTVTIGNLLVALLAPLQKLSLSNFFWIFAVLMAAGGGGFWILASFYKGKSYLQDSAKR